MELVRSASNLLQRITLKVFADFQVSGRENVPPMGPLIIVANHQSNVDPALLSAYIPRRVWFLAKAGIFGGPLVSWFLRHYGAFPLNRGKSDLRAYRWALGKLERDEVLVLFPEGTRNAGGMKRAQPGVTRLALKSHVPLLPVAITGTERLGTWMRVFFPTGRMRMNIGTAFSIPSIEGRPSKEVVDSITDMIMGRIALLLPPSHHGVYKVNDDAASSHPEPAGKVGDGGRADSLGDSRDTCVES